MVRKLMAVSMLAWGAWLFVPGATTSVSATPICEQVAGSGAVMFAAPAQPACVPYPLAVTCDSNGSTNVLNIETIYDEVCVPAP